MSLSNNFLNKFQLQRTHFDRTLNEVRYPVKSKVCKHDKTEDTCVLDDEAIRLVVAKSWCIESGTECISVKALVAFC